MSYLQPEDLTSALLLQQLRNFVYEVYCVLIKLVICTTRMIEVIPSYNLSYDGIITNSRRWYNI